METQANSRAVRDGRHAHPAADTPVRDLRPDAACTAVTIGGINNRAARFGATGRAAAAMDNRASWPSHFYRVEGLEIATAFSSIASNITSLRLVQ